MDTHMEVQPKQPTTLTTDERHKKDADSMIHRWGLSGFDGWLGLYNLHMLGIKALKTLQCKSILDAGCGLGQVIVAGDNEKLFVEGFDENRFLKEYFDTQFSHLAHRYHVDSIAEVAIKPTFDALYSIEVFEHVSDEDLTTFLTRVLYSNIRLIYFSSVPPSEQPKIYAQDMARGLQHPDNYETSELEWGHINLKEKEEWKQFFDEHDFKFLRDEPVVASWGMIFTRR